MIYKILFISFLLFACSGGTNHDRKEIDFKSMRTEMVEKQIKARGITNKLVLDAMLKVERHKFVPAEYQKSAYSDSPLPIGEGQTISQPYIVGLMTQCLDPKKGDKVLEIGTGSGYQAAILAEIVKEVYTIEIVQPLADSAKDRLLKLGYKNIEVVCGDGFAGLKDKAPFDSIIVTAACDKVPAPLFEQLKEGGKMVIPIGESLSYQTLTIVTKEKGKMMKSPVTGVVFVPLTGEHGFGKD